MKLIWLNGGGDVNSYLLGGLNGQDRPVIMVSLSWAWGTQGGKWEPNAQGFPAAWRENFLVQGPGFSQSCGLYP